MKRIRRIERERWERGGGGEDNGVQDGVGPAWAFTKSHQQLRSERLQSQSQQNFSAACAGSHKSS